MQNRIPNILFLLLIAASAYGNNVDYSFISFSDTINCGAESVFSIKFINNTNILFYISKTGKFADVFIIDSSNTTLNINWKKKAELEYYFISPHSTIIANFYLKAIVTIDTMSSPLHIDIADSTKSNRNATNTKTFPIVRKHPNSPLRPGKYTIFIPVGHFGRLKGSILDSITRDVYVKCDK